MNNKNFTIITFYQFKRISEPEKIKKLLEEHCKFNKLRGTILIAKEGINGTLAGLEHDLIYLIKELKEKKFNNLELKKSYFKYMPFNRLKIKVKKEIITFAKVKLDVEKNKAHHVNPENWNELINDKETIVLDVRNDFENSLGTFKNSINPKTKSFSDFKKFVVNNLSHKKNKKIAMFCTGGIRCEKASSYMTEKGFNDLYQLKGGILKYLENIPEKKSVWKGECFVFDNRVSVKNKLKNGTYELCHGCRMPVSSKDRKSKKYVKGISCPSCYKKLTPKKKSKLIERNKQIDLSKKKGLYNPYLKYTTSDFY